MNDYFLGKCSLIVGDDQFWGISAHFLGGKWSLFGLSDAWVGFLGYTYKSTKKSWHGSDPPPFLAMPGFSLLLLLQPLPYLRTGTGNPLPHHTRAPHPPIGDYKHFKHWLYFTLLALAPLLELCWCLNWYNFIGWVPRRSGGVPKVHPAHEAKRKKAKDKSNDHLRRWHRFYCTGTDAT